MSGKMNGAADQFSVPCAINGRWQRRISAAADCSLRISHSFQRTVFRVLLLLVCGLKTAVPFV